MNNPIPNLPLVESPIFQSLLDDGTFGEHAEAAKKVNEDGYAIIDAIPGAKIDAVLDELKDFFSSSYNREQDSWKKHRSVADIATDQSVLDTLRVLYGREPIPFQTLVFPYGTAQDAHSDAVHFSCWPHGFMCGVWTALEDIHPDSGPLFYYPGSNKMPYVETYHIGVSGDKDTTQEVFKDYWQHAIDCAGYKKELFLPKKGESLIWSANLIHGGSKHNFSRTRKSMVTHYYFEDCYYYTPLTSDVTKNKITFRSPARVK